MRQLIKKILKEERQKDLSPKIKKLLQDSVKPNHKMICKIDVVAPDKMYEDPTGRDYQVMVSVIGGIGSKHWPMTQFVIGSRDKIVNDVWHTVYNFMGLSTDVFLRNVKSCDEVMSESTIPNTLKRRANQQTLEKYISNGEINYPTLCDDFEDGYEYADKVIDYAIDEFIYEIDDNIDDEDYYSDVMDYLRNLCRNEFGEELIHIYNETCIENIKEENFMSEGLHDTSWQNDEGDKITLVDLLDATEDIPVKNVLVNKLKSKLLTWDGDEKEIAKIERANLKYPILIFVDDKNKFISIIDGHHRAQKAVRHKLKTIKAKLIPINSLPKDIKKVFGHLGKKEQNESKITKSSNEKLEKLIGNYITMSYPTAKKFRLAFSGVNGSITTFTLPDPEDERDNLIFKFDVFGKPEYNINPEFFNSINSMFGTKRNIKKIILKWFEDKEVDVDLIKNPDTQKQEQNENLNESKMLDYLKQFLSGEVLDNYRKEKGRKEFQKMVDMVYKITAKDNPIEGMVGVLVGNIDKSNWGVSFNDPNSVGARWDFKVILKPVFTNYNPTNDPEYNERVLNFEDEFNRNARGMGFEVISPIQHEKVKNYKVNFEWASRLDVKPID